MSFPTGFHQEHKIVWDIYIIDESGKKEFGEVEIFPSRLISSIKGEILIQVLYQGLRN